MQRVAKIGGLENSPLKIIIPLAEKHSKLCQFVSEASSLLHGSWLKIKGNNCTYFVNWNIEVIKKWLEQNTFTETNIFLRN